MLTHLFTKPARAHIYISTHAGNVTFVKGEITNIKSGHGTNHPISLPVRCAAGSSYTHPDVDAPGVELFKMHFHSSACCLHSLNLTLRRLCGSVLSGYVAGQAVLIAINSRVPIGSGKVWNTNTVFSTLLTTCAAGKCGGESGGNLF